MQAFSPGKIKDMIPTAFLWLDFTSIGVGMLL